LRRKKIWAADSSGDEMKKSRGKEKNGGRG